MAVLRPEQFPLTDRGNAERLVERWVDDIRFVPQLGWHVWDGRRFRVDDDGALVRLEKEATRDLGRLALGLDDGDLRKRLLAHVARSESLPKIRAAIELAQTDQRIIRRVDELDADPLRLNVANGVVDLEAGDIDAHSRDVLITKLAPVAVDWNAKPARWLRFLEEIFAGDQQLIDYVQRAVGYSLTGLTSEQVLFILHGSGANGKSTFIETLRALLGDYAQQTPAETLMARKTEAIRNDIARLPGARLVAAVETGQGRRLDETLVKTLTGGDTVTARKLYHDFFEFVPAFKVWLATNHRPEIRGVDDAIWRRIHLIPFRQSFPADRRDPNLREKLQAELPGILAWAILGTYRWLRDGLQPPATVLAATDGYRAEMDVLGQFIDEACVTGATLSVKAADLYSAYETWARDAGEHPLTKKAFGQQLADRGYTDRKGSGGTRYRDGLSLLYQSVGGA